MSPPAVQRAGLGAVPGRVIGAPSGRGTGTLVSRRWAPNGAHGGGDDPDRVTVGGHSAGAHLASFLAAARPGEPFPADPPGQLLLLSGLYDPAPLRHSVLQEETGPTEEDCAWAPLAGPPPRASITLVVGEAETAPFHLHAQALATRWGGLVLAAAGEDHMSLVHALWVPGTAVHDALARVIGTGLGPLLIGA